MFKDRIREHYDDLTSGFRQVADYIIDNTLEIAFLTASDLARNVGVDPATIVRFSQELGYSGSKELLDEVKDYVHNQVTSSRQAFKEAGSVEEQTQGLTALIQQRFQHFSGTELPSLVQAAKILSEARHIWIVGEYMSYDIAALLVKAFSLIGISSSLLHPDKGSIAGISFRLQPEDVLLALASLDPGVDTSSAVRLARENGVHTIAITGSSLSAPAREAEVSVSVPIKNPVGVPNLSVLMLVMILVWEIVAYQKTGADNEYFVNLRDELEFLLTGLRESPW
jgi:DNA-binding MurR/RpiR family transcriptional regulator